MRKEVTPKYRCQKIARNKWIYSNKLQTAEERMTRNKLRESLEALVDCEHR